jgi:hypothetical protein
MIDKQPTIMTDTDTLAAAAQTLNDLREYLSSSKFDTNTTVQVGDVLRWINRDELRFAAPTPPAKHYYCVSYALGVAVCANTGDRYGANYHRFDSSTERDEYVDGGGDFRTSNDWRESLLASDRELKSAITHAEVFDA